MLVSDIKTIINDPAYSDSGKVQLIRELLAHTPKAKIIPGIDCIDLQVNGVTNIDDVLPGDWVINSMELVSVTFYNDKTNKSKRFTPSVGDHSNLIKTSEVKETTARFMDQSVVAKITASFTGRKVAVDLKSIGPVFGYGEEGIRRNTVVRIRFTRSPQ